MSAFKKADTAGGILAVDCKGYSLSNYTSTAIVDQLTAFAQCFGRRSRMMQLGKIFCICLRMAILHSLILSVLAVGTASVYNNCGIEIYYKVISLLWSLSTDSERH